MRCLGKIRSCTLAIVHVKSECLFDIHVEVSSRNLDTSLEFEGRGRGGLGNMGVITHRMGLTARNWMRLFGASV